LDLGAFVTQRSLKMLVADDSRTIQLFFRNAVAKSGQAVELIATEGRPAVRRIARAATSISLSST